MHSFTHTCVHTHTCPSVIHICTALVINKVYKRPQAPTWENLPPQSHPHNYSFRIQLSEYSYT